MRRSFRHELILLLVQSDFLKSLAAILFPVVRLSRGNIPSDSVFCQVNGFFLAVSIAASDVAVLLIALHSVMYIFRPRSGLYPHRHIAYCFFYLYPATAASLAFIGGNGYENVGHYCSLRSDTGWNRLRLSWIPRYIVCISIVIIYAFIYLYIWRRVGDYGRSHSEAWQQSWLTGDSATLHPTHRHSYHRLISSVPSSRRTSATDTITSAKRKHRATCISVFRFGGRGKGATTTQPTGLVRWNWAGFTQAQPSGNRHPSDDDAVDPADPGARPISSLPAIHVHNHPTPPCDQSLNPQHDIHSRVFDSAHHNNTNETQHDHHATEPHHRLPRMLRVLASPPHQARSPSTSTSTSLDMDHKRGPRCPSSASASPSATLPSSPCIIAAQRDRIRRQLRSLLAYPLVYAVVWLFPFVSHVLRTDNTVRGDEPAWILVVSAVSLCSQGAADCGLFLWRERPWSWRQYHAAGKGGRNGAEGERSSGSGSWWWRVREGGWGWMGGGRMERWGDGGGDGVGRSKEEALIDGRLARERREGEIMVEIERAATRGVEREQRGPPKEWWEVWEQEVEGDGQDRDDDCDADDDRGDERKPAAVGRQGS
ncbi:hypothetical protein VTK26DRAFT_4380 [Humicola hyalothermophila]